MSEVNNDSNSVVLSFFCVNFGLMLLTFVLYFRFLWEELTEFVPLNFSDISLVF